MKQIVEKMLYLSGSILFRVLLIGLFINLIGSIAGIKPVAVKSGSMEPAIQTGSICWINFNADKKKLETGDIVAFERGDGQLVLHRIVKCSKKGLITKGDANETEDLGTVRWNQVKGKQLFGLPYIGYFFLRTEKQMVISLLAGSLVLSGLFIIQSKSNQKQIQKKENKL